MSEVLAPQAIHRVAIFAFAARTFREALLPVAIAALLGRGVSREGLIAAGIGVAILTPVAALSGWMAWRRTRYGVRDGAVYLDSGVFRRTHVAIPIGRVEGLDVSAGPIHRWFGVVTLKAQVAGGGERAELALTALAPSAVDELRRAIGLPASPPIDEPAWTLGRGTLLAGALTWGRVGILAPMVAAVAGSLDDIAVDRVEDGLAATPGTIAILVAAILGAAWLLSIGAAVVSFGGFRVWREPDRLRIARGIFQRRDVSIPVERIRAVRIVEGLLRQPFGLAMVRIEVAGLRQEGVESQLLCPVIRRRDAPDLIARLVPHLTDPFRVDGTPTASAALSLAGPVTAAVAIGAVATLVAGRPGAWAFLAVILALLVGIARWRAARVLLPGDRLLLRFRRLALTTLVTNVPDVQRCAARQGPAERVLGRASLVIGTGSGRSFTVPHQPAAQVTRVFHVVAKRITRRPERRRPAVQLPYPAARSSGGTT